MYLEVIKKNVYKNIKSNNLTNRNTNNIALHFK